MELKIGEEALLLLSHNLGTDSASALNHANLLFLIPFRLTH